jgi:hypothetical protein
MSWYALLIVLAGCGLAGVCVWACAAPLGQETSFVPQAKIEALLPSHTEHFPQLKRSLNTSDAKFVRRRATRAVRRAWRRERTRILRAYISGLEGDFARLRQLRRVLEAQFPNSTAEHAAEWSRQSLHFRLMLRRESLCIRIRGTCSMRRFANLAGCVGGLAAMASAAMLRCGVGTLESAGPNDSIA